MSTPEPGLRELKKQMTRETIADAALRLTVEKGLERVTIDEIAKDAFVSPRTVSNYFSGKEEAVVTAGSQEWFTIAADFGAREPGEAPLQALCEVTCEFARTRTRRQLDVIVEKYQLVQRYPTLHPYQVEIYDQLEEAVRDAVAERSGTDVDTDMYPWLVAAAAVAATRTAFRMWMWAGAETEDLVPRLQSAFNQYSAGLPEPGAGKKSSTGRRRRPSSKRASGDGAASEERSHDAAS